MHNVKVLDRGLPVLSSSVAACIACILEIEASAVPAPPAGHPEPWTVWRNWLGERGLGLVPVHAPHSFEWPGPWIALIRSHSSGDLAAAVAFGAPPGLAWNPLGARGTFEDVEAGYVLVPADVALWTPVQTTTSRSRGHVETLALARPAARGIDVAIGESAPFKRKQTGPGCARMSASSGRRLGLHPFVAAPD